jgi:serine/threonine protein kinase
MLSGTVPFDFTETEELIHAHIARKPPLVNELRPEIPMTIASLIDKLLSKSVLDRYRDADAVLVDLQWLQQELEWYGLGGCRLTTSNGVKTNRCWLTVAVVQWKYNFGQHRDYSLCAYRAYGACVQDSETIVWPRASITRVGIVVRPNSRRHNRDRTDPKPSNRWWQLSIMPSFCQCA